MDRLPHDHPSVEQLRARVARHGGRTRRLEVPGDVLPDEAVVRVVLEEHVRFGSVEHRPNDDVDWLTGVFESASQARASARAGDQLSEWLERNDRAPGDTVHVDVISPAYAIGLRAPGERAIYPTLEPPDASLDAIARTLDDE